MPHTRPRLQASGTPEASRSRRQETNWASRQKSGTRRGEGPRMPSMSGKTRLLSCCDKCRFFRAPPRAGHNDTGRSGLRETSRTRKKASQAEQAGTGAGAGTGISAPLRTGKAGHDDVAGAPLSYSRSCCYCQRLCLPCGTEESKTIASPESRQTTDRTSHLDR